MGDRKRIFHSFASKIKEYDQFGKPVSLTFEGEDTFKTVFGGAVSLLLWCMVFVFFYIKSVEFFGKTDPEVNKQEVHISLIDSEEINLMEHNFMFSIDAPDPRLARVTMYQVELDTKT